jgi:hypothetical protein
MIFCGAFEYRTGDPMSLFPVLTAVHDSSSPVVMMNPAYLPFADSLLLNTCAGRPYSEKVLVTGSSAAQYGSSDCGFQLGWNSFGSDFYREHTFSLKAGYSFFPFLHGGVSENLYLLRIRTGDLDMTRSSAQTDLSLLFNPARWINLSYIQASIPAMFNEKDSDLIYPERSAGILLKPGKGFSFSWNITDTAIEKVNSFSVTVNPAAFMSLTGGYCREDSSIAGCLSVLAGNFFISYGLRFHPHLGYTHSIGVTYASKPAIECLDYGTTLFTSAQKKINIQTASADELKNIAGLKPISARRIILFRDKIGPVTEKSLIQIGLSSDEIKTLEESVYGLSRTKEKSEDAKKFKRHRTFKKFKPRNERIKEKFRRMIAGGIPAYTAITYSELSESASLDEFHNRLWKDSSLDQGQKNLVEKICTN